MDVSKVKSSVVGIKSAIANAKTAINELTATTIKAGAADPSQFAGLAPLGAANLGLDKLLERVDGVMEKVEHAAEKTAPKVKKEKEKKADKK